MTDLTLLLMVAEPWDFESSDGKNRLRCWTKANALVENAKGDYILVRCTPFTDNGEEVANMLLLPRHKEHPLK